MEDWAILTPEQSEFIQYIQAKASYEAGIKKVVDFIEKYLPDPEEYVDPEIWHSFLKEHGMEV